jgi:Lamin Tail Domain
LVTEKQPTGHQQQEAPMFMLLVLSCALPSATHSSPADTTSPDTTQDDTSSQPDDTAWPTEPTSVVLNEVMAHVEYGGDWLELYNLSENDADIGGYVLRDSNGGSDSLPEGTMISGRSVLLVRCGGLSDDPEEPSVAIRLSKTGETLELYHLADGNIVWDDEVTWSDLTGNLSLARQPDGEGAWATDDSPTPGASNQ